MALDLSGQDELDVPIDVLRELSERARLMGIRMIVIGAAARDLVVHAPARQQPRRGTLDVDVAIAVDEGGFVEFCQEWAMVGANEHKRLVLGIEVDVVPYGPMERTRTVTLNDGHVLDVNGLAEADAHAVPVFLGDGLVVRVASLPAQAALKILGWRDRHLANSKDARDLQSILDAAAAPPHVDEVWDDHAALEWSDYDIDLAAAWVTGRQAAEAFAPQYGQAVLDVVGNPLLRHTLVRDMGALLSGDQIDAFRVGFEAGLGTGEGSIRTGSQ